MKILVDTNVLMDILLKREPFFEESLKAVELAIRSAPDEETIFVSATAITDIFYIANRNLKDKSKSKDLVKDLLTFASVASVTDSEIQLALKSNFKDFEDAVVDSVGQSVHVDAILTRNEKHFVKSSLKILTPIELTILLDSQF